MTVLDKWIKIKLNKVKEVKTPKESSNNKCQKFSRKGWLFLSFNLVCCKKNQILSHIVPNSNFLQKERSPKL